VSRPSRLLVPPRGGRRSRRPCRGSLQTLAGWGARGRTPGKIGEACRLSPANSAPRARSQWPSPGGAGRWRRSLAASVPAGGNQPAKAPTELARAALAPGPRRSSKARAAAVAWPWPAPARQLCGHGKPTPPAQVRGRGPDAAWTPLPGPLQHDRPGARPAAPSRAAKAGSRC